MVVVEEKANKGGGEERGEEICGKKKALKSAKSGGGQVVEMGWKSAHIRTTAKWGGGEEGEKRHSFLVHLALSHLFPLKTC